MPRSDPRRRARMRADDRQRPGRLLQQQPDAVLADYVRNMKKTLPKGKKTELATGARMAYEKHKVHLWGQLEKFFAEFNGGQSTYTPRTV